ncbi:hypothetical protein BDP55DRAFT_629970 [Colletotrichum godetiae]|uniref:Uncharacterized protein n=1 Tax=Colletotrichum godetiae TaxID=1209918 RepID=A0AAJ0ASY7_9PEZI|nr:uncharacterized protein BDP55DRAFT_629970 [Colletotrichum godetiae]KAK1688381.1 hypothetical protein BDP55DRAFT_629970 [Colletotrichum godetiae]
MEREAVEMFWEGSQARQGSACGRLMNCRDLRQRSKAPPPCECGVLHELLPSVPCPVPVQAVAPAVLHPVSSQEGGRKEARKTCTYSLSLNFGKEWKSFHLLANAWEEPGGPRTLRGLRAQFSNARNTARCELRTTDTLRTHGGSADVASHWCFEVDSLQKNARSHGSFRLVTPLGRERNETAHDRPRRHREPPMCSHAALASHRGLGSKRPVKGGADQCHWRVYSVRTTDAIVYGYFVQTRPWAFRTTHLFHTPHSQLADQQAKTVLGSWLLQRKYEYIVTLFSHPARSRLRPSALVQPVIPLASKEKAKQVPSIGLDASTAASGLEPSCDPALPGVCCIPLLPRDRTSTRAPAACLTNIGTVSLVDFLDNFKHPAGTPIAFAPQNHQLQPLKLGACRDTAVHHHPNTLQEEEKKEREKPDSLTTDAVCSCIPISFFDRRQTGTSTSSFRPPTPNTAACLMPLRMHTTNDVSIPANGLPLTAALSTLSARKSHHPISHIYSGAPRRPTLNDISDVSC